MEVKAAVEWAEMDWQDFEESPRTSKAACQALAEEIKRLEEIIDKLEMEIEALTDY